jgi:hypothetical protein
MAGRRKDDDKPRFEIHFLNVLLMFSPSIFKWFTSPTLERIENTRARDLGDSVGAITQSSTAHRSFDINNFFFVCHAKSLGAIFNMNLSCIVSTLNAKHLRHLSNSFEKHERWEMCVGWGLKDRSIFLLLASPEGKAIDDDRNGIESWINVNRINMEIS